MAVCHILESTHTILTLKFLQVINSIENRNIEGHILDYVEGKSFFLWVSNKVSQMIYDPNCLEILMILGHLWISVEF